MPPDPIEIKRGLALQLKGSLALRLCFPGDRAAADCPSPQTVFWMGRNSRHSLGSGWPGRGCQGYSLDVQEGTGSEAEAGHSSKIV